MFCFLFLFLFYLLGAESSLQQALLSGVEELSVHTGLPLLHACDTCEPPAWTTSKVWARSLSLTALPLTPNPVQ